MTANYRDMLLQVMRSSAYTRLMDITSEIQKVTESTVKSGPFAGMILPTQYSNYDASTDCGKLLGFYESELHASLEKAIQRNPDIVINVGCAEGFYAIGLAQRLPHAEIHAFETNPKLLEICHFAAQQNNVSDRIHLHGHCTADELERLASDGKKTFILMDCEGDEAHLLHKKNIGSFSSCDFVVECHEFVDRTSKPFLSQLLRIHHNMEVIQEGSRNPSAYPELRFLNSFERWLTVCEFRPEVMSWLTAWAENR